MIRFINKKPKLQEKEVTITENGTQTLTPDTGNDGLSSVEITTNVSGGGGGGVEEKDVNFYDYDGTLLYSYTKNEFLALTAMPTNPTHTGLTAQGWNWDLSDAKTYVTDYGELDVGQVYTTASGLSEFDIELTPVTGLTVNLYMSGTKNWGDGTSNTNTSHTYTNYGKYTIACGGSMSSFPSSSGLFGQNQSTFNYYVKECRIIGIPSNANFAFQECKSLKTITIANNNSIQLAQNFFTNCWGLKHLTIPANTILDRAAINGCYCLKTISLAPNTSSSANSTLNNNYSLKKIVFPNTYSSGTGNLVTNNYNLEKAIIPSSFAFASNTFANCCNIKVFNLTKFTSVPSLSVTTTFEGINKLAKIIVPDSLYTDWIEASNWVTYADYIVKESDYSGS